MPMFSSELPIVDDQCPAGHSWLVSPHSVAYPIRKWMSYIYIYWLVVSNMAGLFSIIYIYGMSSFPLTHIFQRGGEKPPTNITMLLSSYEPCDDPPSTK